VEKQRKDADLCQDTGIKGMHFGPYRAEGSKSLLSPHVFGARGSILGGASAGAEEASPVRDGSDVLPMCCCVALFRGGCGSAALFQGRSDQQAQLQNSKGRLTNPGTKGGRPSPAPARISLAYSRTNFFLPSPLLG
jgi:hypothetical protein